MKTYKLKSLAYFACFVVAIFAYNTISQETEQTVTNHQETIAEADLGQISSTNFTAAEDLE